MNRQTLRDFLKFKISNLYEKQFNEMIDNIFSILYGEDFKCIKQHRDLGSDGIIEAEKICLACYAPEKYESNKFKRKVDDDFRKYKANYANLGYKWRFITNQKLLGSAITHIKKKDTNAEIWGIEELINFILRLSPSKRRKILEEVFSLSKELIEYDFIEEVIEEISKLKEKESLYKYKPKYKPPADTIRKIEKNFDREDVNILKKTFNIFYAEHINYLLNTLKAFGNDFISHLKVTVLREFANLSEKLTFKEKFNILLNRFSEKYPNDEEYKNYVELILLYLFEQCLIGEEP